MTDLGSCKSAFAGNSQGSACGHYWNRVGGRDAADSRLGYGAAEAEFAAPARRRQPGSGTDHRGSSTSLVDLIKK
jgi:hypothetical protein